MGGTFSPKKGLMLEKSFSTHSSFRLIFSKREQVLCLIALLYGNHRFPARHQLFTQWSRGFLDQNLNLMRARLTRKLQKKGSAPAFPEQSLDMLYHQTKDMCLPAEQCWYNALVEVERNYAPTNMFCPIDTGDSWLSGFFEAEGTFRCQFYSRPKLKRGYSVALGLEIRQNDAEDQFRRLKTRFGGHLRLEGKSWQLRIASQESLRELKEYFKRYSLRGRKKIAQSRWIRAYELREKNLVVPPKGTLEYRKFLRLFQCVNGVKD